MWKQGWVFLHICMLDFCISFSFGAHIHPVGYIKLQVRTKHCTWKQLSLQGFFQNFQSCELWIWKQVSVTRILSKPQRLEIKRLLLGSFHSCKLKTWSVRALLQVVFALCVPEHYYHDRHCLSLPVLVSSLHELNAWDLHQKLNVLKEMCPTVERAPEKDSQTWVYVNALWNVSFRKWRIWKSRFESCNRRESTVFASGSEYTCEIWKLSLRIKSDICFRTLVWNQSFMPETWTELMSRSVSPPGDLDSWKLWKHGQCTFKIHYWCSWSLDF